MLELEPGQPDRDRGQDDHPGQLLVGGADLAVADRGEEPADDPDPVPPEVDDQRHGGGHVQADDEGQVGRLGGGDVQVAGPGAADQGRNQHGMAQAGDWEHLRNALDEADDRGLEVGQVSHKESSGSGGCRAGSRVAYSGPSGVLHAL